VCTCLTCVACITRLSRSGVRFRTVDLHVRSQRREDAYGLLPLQCYLWCSYSCILRSHQAQLLGHPLFMLWGYMASTNNSGTTGSSATESVQVMQRCIHWSEQPRTVTPATLLLSTVHAKPMQYLLLRRHFGLKTLLLISCRFISTPQERLHTLSPLAPCH
jgi:hypothetical protein